MSHLRSTTRTLRASSRRAWIVRFQRILREWRRGLKPDLSRSPEPDEVVRPRSMRRLAWVGAGMGCLYLGLAVRSAWIMLMPDAQLQERAQVQFERLVTVHGRRGNILDRNGRILATSVELSAVHANPHLLKGHLPNGLVDELAEVLGQSPRTLARRLKREDRRDVVLARRVPPARARRIRKLARDLARRDSRLRWAIWVRDEPHRFYPGEGEAAALLGIVGYQGKGRAGLEYALDSTLRGDTVKYVLLRDRKDRQVTPREAVARSGKDVVLTIDERMQHIAEVALDGVMERTKPHAAHAVVMDVHTGEILALANRPTVNPNDIAHIDLMRLQDHAAVDAFEPGSVFKPFIVSAALQEGLVRPNTLIDCEGGVWRIGRTRIHDHEPHGELPVEDIIKYSSNIGAAKLAFKLGADRVIDYLKRFGFSRPTGLDLPGEPRGFLRAPERIKPIELATTAYGQGVNVTTVQLAAAVAALGNGGVRMKPHLIREIREHGGEVIREVAPEVDQRVVSADVAHEVVRMMVRVTERGGTATRARVKGYEVAGKTGTAWKYENGGYSSSDRIGSFMGLVPANDPRLAIVVVVDAPTEGPRYGGIVAAPAFSEIAGKAMRLLGVPPDPALEDDEESIASAQVPTEDDGPAVASALTWTDRGHLRVPELAGLSLRDALSALDGAGLAISVNGSGRVFRQDPRPGALVAPGQQVRISLQ